eukprot:scaffold27984_cov113-Isochrysis_galbana.AAC.4
MPSATEPTDFADKAIRSGRNACGEAAPRPSRTSHELAPDGAPATLPPATPPPATLPASSAACARPDACNRSSALSLILRKTSSSDVHSTPNSETPSPAAPASSAATSAW